MAVGSPFRPGGGGEGLGERGDYEKNNCYQTKSHQHTPIKHKRTKQNIEKSK